MGFDSSVALLGVGYIVGLEVAILVFIGGFISWGIALPFMTFEGGDGAGALEFAWQAWSQKIRFIGVGAMLVGGMVSVWSVRSGLQEGFARMTSLLRSVSGRDEVERETTDLSVGLIVSVLALCFVIMVGLYRYLLDSMGMSFLTAIVMVCFSFPCVAVSSYLVGLVGSSNNPVSGITIAVLLLTAGFFLAIGYQGQGGILATLGVAAVVCCAACTAGDCSQDLKTGHLLHAKPRNQQLAQIVGVVLPAMVIAPVLSVLHHAEGIGQGLKAPQATLFASIVQSIFGDGNLPFDMLFIGIAIALVIQTIDWQLKLRETPFRLHIMPLAVGLYLPLSLAVPVFLGGLIRYFTTSPRVAVGGTGILLASGMIAGESIIGVFLAGLKYFDVALGLPLELSVGARSGMSLVAMGLIAGFFYRSSKTQEKG